LLGEVRQQFRKLNAARRSRNRLEDATHILRRMWLGPPKRKMKTQRLAFPTGFGWSSPSANASRRRLRSMNSFSPNQLSPPTRSHSRRETRGERLRGGW
jgi:hypothetical protein